MDTITALKERRSVRRYLPDPVPEKILEEIVDCGRLAATARNDQPWEFIVVTDAETRGRIAGITDYGKFIKEAPACIVVFCKDTKYYLEDGSAATQNILVAAKANNLGSCWVAGDKKTYGKDIARLLGVPDEYRLVSMVAVGTPKEIPAPAKRPLQEVLHLDKW